MFKGLRVLKITILFKLIKLAKITKLVKLAVFFSKFKSKINKLILVMLFGVVLLLQQLWDMAIFYRRVNWEE